MPSLHDIKRRIVSVKSTRKITRAMKLVAASKLRRAQEAIIQARPYAHRMRGLVDNLALRADLDAHPLLRQTSGSGPVGLIVLTSDRGLCGGFNSNIVNATLAKIETEFAGREVELTAIGKKGVDLLKRRGCTIHTAHIDVFEGSVMETAGEIIAEVAQEFATGGTDSVYCLYNAFHSAVFQEVTLEQLLPFEPTPAESPTVDYRYEPSETVVFDRLLAKHMQIQMHRILHESAASEHGARMTAMDSATNNAGDMIDRLTLQYNRARQDAITTELIEVVSGAEAL